MKYLPTLSKFQIKLILIAVGFIIVIAAVVFTNVIVDELIKTEQSKIQFYANLYKKMMDPDELQKILESTQNSEEEIQNAENEMQELQSYEDEIDFMANMTKSTISFPVIITDKDDSASYPYDQWSLNLDLDTTLSLQEQREYVHDYIKRMKSSYEPIIVKTKNGDVLFKLYYTNTVLLDKLLLFPFVVSAVIGLFIIIGYMAFSNIRRNQESKVWVGMSKEAAHQLGTPLSSLLAWIEILKYNKENPEYIEETLKEMESDLNRLNIIARRFSKIGSKPELKKASIGGRLENICLYYEKRLPHLGKRIDILRKLDDNTYAEINDELFAWVIENLLKNAADAIETKEGLINVSIESTDKKIHIILHDTGKGMTPKQRRQAFNPGFTTKKRGWGLGLTLCKRIIEEYHNGKIYIKESNPDAGTTFVIELPAAKA